MTALPEVAADVAQALGLREYGEKVWEDESRYEVGWAYLERDGSNLTDPYWRCRCEDWLYGRDLELCGDPERKRYVATGEWHDPKT